MSIKKRKSFLIRTRLIGPYHKKEGFFLFDLLSFYVHLLGWIGLPSDVSN